MKYCPTTEMMADMTDGLNCNNLTARIARTTTLNQVRRHVNYIGTWKSVCLFHVVMVHFLMVCPVVRIFIMNIHCLISYIVIY